MVELNRTRLWPLALVLLLLLGGLLLYRAGVQDPYARALAAADRAFADADYLRALKAYDEAAQGQPDAFDARFGRALALLQLQREPEALEAFARALEVADSDEQRAFLLANRGILHDRAGRHEQALSDYAAALTLSERVAQGPGWVSRFAHNQAAPAATVADRARYLRQELAKPAGERRLRLPEADAEQFPYRP